MIISSQNKKFMLQPFFLAIQKLTSNHFGCVYWCGFTWWVHFNGGYKRCLTFLGTLIYRFVGKLPRFRMCTEPYWGDGDLLHFIGVSLAALVATSTSRWSGASTSRWSGVLFSDARGASWSQGLGLIPASHRAATECLWVTDLLGYLLSCFSL